MSGIPVGRILGFEIRIHATWVLILAMLGIVVAGRLEESAPGMPVALRFAVATLAAIVFLVSVLGHELAHGIVARRRGLEPGPITVYFFGGSASYDVEWKRPADEAAVASAGPIVSLAIGFALLATGYLIDTLGGAVVGPFGFAIVLVGAMNLALGGINLVPAFPLDAGRVLHAFVWRRTGDERRGARATALFGKGLGWVLVAAGLGLSLVSTVEGVMVALTGWLLTATARSIDRRLVVEDLLSGVRVGEVMERDAMSIPPQLTLDTFAEQVLDMGSGAAVPVVRDDDVVGVISGSQLRRLRRQAWPTTRAEQLMLGGAELTLLAPDDGLWSAIQRIRRTGAEGLPVVDASGLLGVLTVRSIVAAIQARAQRRGVSVP